LFDGTVALCGHFFDGAVSGCFFGLGLELLAG